MRVKGQTYSEGRQGNRDFPNTWAQFHPTREKRNKLVEHHNRRGAIFVLLSATWNQVKIMTWIGT
jgi:hypothetical protein